jgi:ATP-binding cassette, subfamily F, member 3
VVWQRPNLLLLDEPTNHLDLEMRQALAVALQEYAGAMVLVSHDRHLLRTVADEFRIVHGGKAEPFDGDLEDYAKWLESAADGRASASQRTADDGAASGAAPSSSEAASAPPRDSADARKQRKREEAERRNRLAPLKAQLARHEADLDRLAKRTTAVQAELTAPEVYADSSKDRLRALLSEQTSLARETADVEAAWMETTERLESLSRELEP